MDAVERRYRRLHTGEGLSFYRVSLEQSDLSIGTLRPLKPQAAKALEEARSQVEARIREQKEFLTSFVPVRPLIGTGIVPAWMEAASLAAGTGPMAAVAGAIAQYVGRALLADSQDVVVENGGDLYLHLTQPRIAAIYAGDSPLSDKIGIQLPPGEWGLCTSSGRIGPSHSFGSAHAAVVLSHDAALADAAATQLGNLVHGEEDLAAAVRTVMDMPGVEGALAIWEDKLAALGRMKLVPLRIKEK